MNRTLLIIAGSLGAAAVGIGAFGAHGLNPLLSVKNIAIYQTGVSYHFYHVLAILACVALSPGKQQGAWLNRAAWSFIVGIGLFSGSLYVLSCREILHLPPVAIAVLGSLTPMGGLGFIVGWLCMVIHAFRLPR